jgi:guanine deaminase
VVSDRNLRPDLEITPEQAYERSVALRDRWHGRGRLRYAVTPRFSVSCSAAMLDACRALLGDGVMFTSHVNESPGEIAFVRELFPEARDYLDTYERAGLLGRPRTPSWPRASSRCSATSSTACASGWARMSARGPG